MKTPEQLFEEKWAEKAKEMGPFQFVDATPRIWFELGHKSRDAEVEELKGKIENLESDLDGFIHGGL